MSRQQLIERQPRFYSCSKAGPQTSIFVAVPFGGELRTKNATRLAIRAGYAQYKASGAGAADPCTFEVDLYPRAQRGLQGLGSPTAESCDGTHPLAQRHGQLGAMLATEAALVAASAPAGRCSWSGAPRGPTARVH